MVDRIKEAQMKDKQFCKIQDELELGRAPSFIVNKDGVSRFDSKLCVTWLDDLKRDVMTETYQTDYTIHLGSHKMYKNLRECYWWNGMKRDIVEFVSRCLTY
jgi:hypothetical protein